MWAYVTDDGSTAGFFNDPSEHIFFLELRAGMQAILAAAKLNPCQTSLLGMDNTAAMFALRSGHSGNSKADQLLRNFYEILPRTFMFFVLHIRTEFNPADPFTRGLRPDKGQTTVACQRIPHEPPHAGHLSDQHGSHSSVFSFCT